MKRFFYIIITLLTSVLSVSAQDNIIYQQLFNLTKSELMIDSLLPEFTHVVPLSGNYGDSIYSIQLVYPEFSEMSKEQREKCKNLLENADEQASVFNGVAAQTVEFIPKQSGYTLANGLVQQTVCDRKQGKIEIYFSPIVTDGKTYKQLSSFMLRVCSKAIGGMSGKKKVAGATSDAASFYAPHSVLSSGQWAKIGVGEESGFYELTAEVIKKAGFKDLKNVKIYGYGGNLQEEKMRKEYLQQTDDLSEVASTYINGRRYFWGNGTVSYKDETASRTRNPYSQRGYYFITESEGEPLVQDSAAFIGNYYPSPYLYKNHTLYEKEEYAWTRGGRNLYDSETVEVGKIRKYPIDLKNYPETAKNFRVEVVVSAGSNSSYEILANGNKVSQGSISLNKYDDASVRSNKFTLSERPTEITLKPLSGGPFRLDYIDVYCNEVKAPVFSSGTVQEAQYICDIANQDLHADSAYQMVIIIPTSQKFRAQAERLKTFHEQHDGLRVRILSSNELINEFSSGTPDANAYRRYMKMLYDRAQTEDDMPRYLLLFGACGFDNRMISSTWKGTDPDDYLLCYESDNSYSETNTYSNDGFFCLLDEGEGVSMSSSDREDIAVGRIPAKNAAEAKVAVDKIIAYAEKKNAGDWQNVIAIFGDDGDANRHMEDAESVAQRVENISHDFYVKRVMWDTYKRENTSTGFTFPEVEKIVNQQIADGALIIDYSGHGAPHQLSHENSIRLSDFENSVNENLAFWITAACDVTPFDSRLSHFGTAGLFNSNGGAIGFYGTTHSVFPTENCALNKAMIAALITPVNGDYLSLGEAQRIAKNNLITQRTDLTVNKLQYTLLGDPALKLNVPQQKVIIDSINGRNVKNLVEPIKMKAASVARISGHIEKAGTKNDAFNGTLSLTVRDAEKLIVGRKNDPSLQSVFKYYDRTSVLYKGNANVTNGAFSAVFAVPKDIDYSGDTGLITAFAVDKTTFQTAHGSNENFAASGTESVYTDSIGPSIYCYLNSPSFQNGGNVNPTPFFYAEISDKDGINSTGSSYGHDLQLVIDGDINQTYNLNDNFTYELGDYTKGKTFYTLPQLPIGKHTLRFRAWDILNNSSTTTLTFNVVNGLKPELQDISCTKNPARDNTSFIITHNRKGSDVTADIEVMTMAGRPLWKKTVKGASTSGGNFIVDWDLCTEAGGKLQTGVYLYRVRLSSDGSDAVSKAKKLIIIN